MAPHTALLECVCTDIAGLRDTVMPEHTPLFSVVRFQARVSSIGVDACLYKSEPKVSDSYIYMRFFFSQTWVNEQRREERGKGGKEGRGSN